MLARVWDDADLDERRELLFTLFQDVRANPLMERITQLVPYPAYVPLLRLVDGLIESDSGVFAVAFPPGEGRGHFPDRITQLPDPLPDPADFPAGFSVTLPELPPAAAATHVSPGCCNAGARLGWIPGLCWNAPIPWRPPRAWIPANGRTMNCVEKHFRLIHRRSRPGMVNWPF